jgi:hypothetical protein
MPPRTKSARNRRDLDRSPYLSRLDLLWLVGGPVRLADHTVEINPDAVLGFEIARDRQGAGGEKDEAATLIAGGEAAMALSTINYAHHRPSPAKPSSIVAQVEVTRRS